ncbi:unnamed protein product [Mytilus coruscus]|uniref:Uncharacterized protein n=1 Tax=Mytilus coruscus TaxID=42192 RepID=A0A6J7ZSJ9_MYTCO|nr:unnamed protein product [Mytilus coruscus]
MKSDYKQKIYDLLTNEIDRDPKEYWKILKSLKLTDDEKEIPEIYQLEENIIKHIQNQANPPTVNIQIHGKKSFMIALPKSGHLNDPNRGNLGVYRVAVEDKISIASRLEVVVQGEVRNYDSIVKVTGIIEQSKEFLDRGKALIEKSVVHVTSNKIVKLMNISDRVPVLNVSTVVGNLSGAEVVGQVYNDKGCVLSNELEKLLDRSSASPEQGQNDNCLELLLEF